METILQVSQLTGGYSPRKPVLHEINFQIKAGEMVGMMGLNGAGKSTTIKHILGLITPHQGEITIAGTNLHDDPERYRGAFAYVPESPVLFDELTVEEHLRLSGMAYGITEEQYNKRADQLLIEFHMKKKRKAFAAHLSKGMRQKVMIMSALLAAPPLYIIDEPFLGLDPLGIRSLLDKLVEVKASGAAILMSSHVLSTIEHYCDRFIVMHQGSIAAQGDLQAIRLAAGTGSSNITLEDAFYAIVTKDDSA